MSEQTRSQIRQVHQKLGRVAKCLDSGVAKRLLYGPEMDRCMVAVVVEVLRGSWVNATKNQSVNDNDTFEYAMAA